MTTPDPLPPSLPLLARNALSPVAAGSAVTDGARHPGSPPADHTGASPGVARYSVTALVIYGLLIAFQLFGKIG